MADVFQFPTVYLPPTVARSKDYAPRFFQQLMDLFGLSQGLRVVHDLGDLDGRPWIFPVLLNNPYRVSRSLTLKKGGGLLYTDAVSPEEIEALSTKNGRLLLDLIVEAYFPRGEMMDGLHEGMSAVGVPADRVALINGNMQSTRHYHAYCDSKGLMRRARMISFHGCLWMLVGHGQGNESLQSAIYDGSISTLAGRRRAKAFVSFNGRLRHQRLHALLFMLSRGLFERGYVSLLAYSASGANDEGSLRLMNRKMPFAEETDAMIPRLASMLPISLDVVTDGYRDRRIRDEMPWSSPDPTYYLDSYFSLVVDTAVFEPDMLFMTPIAYKSLMNCHPFVYLGGPGALAEMRRLGFQTFSPFIDEGYDDLADPGERTRAALLEFERLARLPLGELHDLYCELWPRLVHNFEHFWKSLPTRFERSWHDDVIRPVLE